MYDTPHVAPENKYARASVDHRVMLSLALAIINTSQSSNVTAPTSSKLGCNNVSTVGQHHHFSRLHKSPAINSSTQMLFEFLMVTSSVHYYGRPM